MPRKLTPYELLELRKHGRQKIDIPKFSDTPVEYITGFTEFYHHDFTVNNHVLIPRIESEQIVTEVLNHCQPGKTYTMADVGTGSGCLGISLLLELTKQRIDSIIYLSDISPEALEIARRNAFRLVPKHLLTHIHFRKSDLLSSYSAKIRFDIIVANPPYIPSRRILKLPKSVRNYEPRLALDGGPRGVTPINKLITELPAHLKPSGLVILEIDATHKLKDFCKIKGYHYQLQKDQFHRHRFLKIQS